MEKNFSEPVIYMGRGLDIISFAALLVIVAVSILLYTPLGYIGLEMTVPFVLFLFGLWLAGLSGFKAAKPAKYERGAFSTFAWGILITAVGGAWFLSALHWAYSLVLLLLVIATLAVASTFRTRKRQDKT